MVEPADGCSPCYVWCTLTGNLEAHDSYHHTKHFREDSLVSYPQWE